MPKYGYAGIMHGVGEYYHIMESRIDRTLENEMGTVVM